MEAISGTRRQMRELADGTIRVQIDIDPSCKKQFQSMFGEIDMPVALAPLVAHFESKSKEPEQKGGELAKLAGQLCQNPRFLEFLGTDSGEHAAEAIRRACGIKSRAELDHDPVAAEQFHHVFRRPFQDWCRQ